MVTVILDEKKFLEDVRKRGLLSAFLRALRGEYGSKSGKGGGTDVNKPGRTLRKRK